MTAMIITKVELWRQLTPAELTARDAYIQTQVDAQVTNGRSAGLYNSTAGIRVWSTVESANAYLEWCNTNLDPPIVDGVVTTVA